MIEPEVRVQAQALLTGLASLDKLTAHPALIARIQETQRRLDELCSKLGCTPETLLDKVEAIAAANKRLKAQQ